MSQGLSPQQLQGRIADQQVTPNERGIFQSTQQAQQRMASNPMAAQQMAQAAPPPQMAQAPSEDARMGGIAQAGGDMFNTMGYAGGGIIAFAEGDVVEEKQKTREAMLAQTQAMMEKQGFKPGATADEQAYADMIAKQQAGLGGATSVKERANLAKAFLKMGANPRGFLPGAIEGAESYLTGAGEIAAGKETREAGLAEAKAKYAAGQRARAAGDIASSDKLFTEAAQLQNQAEIAKNRDATSLEQSRIQASVAGQSTKLEKQAIDALVAKGVPMEEAYQRVKFGPRLDTAEDTQLKNASAALSEQLLTIKKGDPRRAELEEQLAAINRIITNKSLGKSPAASVVTPQDIQDILKKYPAPKG
jgi:hypothetical protein